MNIETREGRRRRIAYTKGPWRKRFAWRPVRVSLDRSVWLVSYLERVRYDCYGARLIEVRDAATPNEHGFEGYR